MEICREGRLAGIPFIEWNNFSFCPVGVARMGRKVVANSVRPEEIFAFSTSTRSLMRAPSSVTSKGRFELIQRTSFHASVLALFPLVIPVSRDTQKTDRGKRVQPIFGYVFAFVFSILVFAYR